MVPFSVTLSDLSTSFQGHFSFLHEMMQSNATMTEMQYKTTKITSKWPVFISRSWPTFFDVLSRKGSYLFPQLLTTNRNSYFIENPMVLFSMTFSDVVKVISRSSDFSTGNNVAASRGLLAIAKFLLELWYTEVVQSDEWISINECSASRYTRS